MGFNISANNIDKKIKVYPGIQQEIDQEERIRQKEQLQKKQKITTEEQRAKAFSLIKKDCQSIPYWIPEPINFKDFNSDAVIERFNRVKNNLAETIKLGRQLDLEHRNQYADDYKRHQELHDSTLDRHYKEYRMGERPLEYVKPTCCYNHYFGLATKRGETKLLPIYDYELHLVWVLDYHNLVTYVASRGLGKTHTIVVSYSTWRVLRSTEWDNQDILMSTGLTQDNSKELLTKIENRFSDSFPSLQLDYTGNELWIDKTRYIAFPTENIKKMRLYDRVAAVFIDEADFYTLREQQRLQEAIFGYVIKANPLISFFSTPNEPTGFLMSCRKRWIEEKTKGRLNNHP